MSSHLGSRVPAQNMVPQHLASDSASGFFAPRFANRVRRRSSLRRALHTEPRFAELSEGFASVRSILLDILNSALDVAAAEQGFVLISRESTVLEVACARHLRPGQVMDLVLGEASQSVHSALREGRMTAVGLNGQPMPVLDGFFEPNRPALLCLDDFAEVQALCRHQHADQRKTHCDLV